jgi:hypothetical protein
MFGALAEIAVAAGVQTPVLNCGGSAAVGVIGLHNLM